MDAMGSALKKKIKAIHVVHHDGHVESVGDLEPKDEKLEDASDLKLDHDLDMDDDKAPEVEDSHNMEDVERQGLHGGSDKDPEGEMKMLKGLSSGGALGRKSMSLTERAKDKMKQRMAHLDGDAIKMKKHK
jgi:hypothetical protein